MRLLRLLAPAVALGALLVAACTDGTVEDPATATPSASPTTTLTGQPATTPPDAATGPWFLTSTDASSGADARRLPLEVDTFGALFMDWNAERDALAYISRGDLWVWHDGASTNLTNTDDRLEGLPRWSPDGRWIAFASRAFEEGEMPFALVAPQGGPSVIEVATPDAGYLVLAEGPLLSPPSWAPDSARLAYASGGEVFTVDRAGTPLSQHSASKAGVGSAFVGVEWSPTTDVMAVTFVDADGDIPVEGEPALMGYALIAENAISVSGDRGLSIVMDWTAGYAPPPSPQWSPDGASLLIAIPPPPASLSADYPSGVWIAEPGPLTAFTGTAPRGPEPVQVGGLTPYQAMWSPDGRWIAVIEDGERRIVILDAATLTVIAQPGPAADVEGIAW
ncbi:MAG: hypothetical protein CVU47_08580 [Chloroflexi bacterium HGW-Chloroflexi-9]|nr:MAG: hypothetical protein CVU47_08580 [Chloroflexi bacterium HGW-Chloroflexi-9]